MMLFLWCNRYPNPNETELRVRIFENATEEEALLKAKKWLHQELRKDISFQDFLDAYAKDKKTGYYDEDIQCALNSIQVVRVDRYLQYLSRNWSSLDSSMADCLSSCSSDSQWFVVCLGWLPQWSGNESNPKVWLKPMQSKSTTTQTENQCNRRFVLYLVLVESHVILELSRKYQSHFRLGKVMRRTNKGFEQCDLVLRQHIERPNGSP